MIGESIKYYRNQNGLTLAQVAEKAQLSTSAISDYENERRIPKQHTLELIARAIGVSSEAIITRSEQGSAAHGRGVAEKSDEKEYDIRRKMFHINRRYDSYTYLTENILAAFNVNIIDLADNNRNRQSNRQRRSNAEELIAQAIIKLVKENEDELNAIIKTELDNLNLTLEQFIDDLYNEADR